MTNDTITDILNFALAEAMTEKLRCATMIKQFADRGITDVVPYRKAIAAFKIACAEVRIIRNEL